MTKSKSIITIAFVLLGLLVVSAVSLTLGRNETRTFPSASSYGPSGAKAFSELLRQQGYRVDISMHPTPYLSQGDVLVAFVKPLPDNPDSDTSEQTEERTARQFLDAYAAKGGHVVELWCTKDFQGSSEEAIGNVSDVRNAVAGQTLKLNLQSATREYAADGDLPLATGPAGETIASLDMRGKGQVLNVSNGISATNRFIARNDNAAELVRLVSAVAPEHAHLVFYEASFGNSSDPGILETLGPWAIAGWWQAIFLFLVIVYSLGKPFGYPDEQRMVQTGARDLVDAVSSVYRRSRATHVAMTALLADADAEIRRKLKLPLEAARSERDRLLPESLSRALLMAEAAKDQRIPAGDALGIAQRLNKELSSFIGERPLHRKRKKF